MSVIQASRTALGTAYARAAHQFLDAEPLVLNDPMALVILGPAAEARIRTELIKYQSPLGRGLRGHVALRSRYAEDRLAASLARGVRQYVILGAGLDTFALRQPEWARSLAIFELDQEASQGFKRQMLAQAGLTPPDNVRLGAIDFQRESLAQGLDRLGVSRDVPTFFSWLGVSMYLDEAAIDALLGSLAAFPEGSEVVLTYSVPGPEGPSPFAQRSAELGEPWLSHFTPEEMEAKLFGLGFSTVEILTPQLATERYFAHRPQDLPLPRRADIAAAVV